MQDFNGKLAVITGGASGVGRSLAFALGAEGARVLIADVDEAGLKATEAALIERNIDARSQRCDVSTQDFRIPFLMASRPAYALRSGMAGPGSGSFTHSGSPA